MGEMKWYVLRAAGGKEKKAKEYLEKEIERSGLQDQVAQVLVPVKKEIVTKNGKRKAVDKLLYPGYVLIQAELSAKLENIIRNLVPGMSGFLTEKKTTQAPSSSASLYRSARMRHSGSSAFRTRTQTTPPRRW